ncbi:spore coat protein GerQ [Paenibacillus sp. NPDC058174]|uniref:spore coat protein GerQ n=1 Tax=Paenibacillus sp. NPDC058174 TaxID=3346366 RepID=UPI0036DF2F56
MGPNVMPNMMPSAMGPNAMPNMMPMMMGKNAPMAGAQAAPPMVPSGSVITPQGGNIVAVPVAEESYVENILRLNRGKMASFYMTYENNREWNAKIFRGIIEAAGRDHIVISDPSTGMRYLLLMLNLDYVTFDGPIQYEYPFQGGVVTNTTPMNNREEEI